MHFNRIPDKSYERSSFDLEKDSFEGHNRDETVPNGRILCLSAESTRMPSMHLNS